VVNLAEWQLNVPMFDGDIAAGPIPTLFADEPELSRTALEAGAAKAHHDLQRIAHCFFMPETVSLEDAFQIVKKPRYYYRIINVNISLLIKN
jgi:hypothetical protein